MEYKELEQKVSDIRAKIKAAYNDINNIESPLLPAKDNGFVAMKENIETESYDVVVCGEVKKGKSSFINAIIGDNLLPVNTEVATSQVFRIVNIDKDEEPAFELVFIDGKRKSITREELTRYGSQVAADEEGKPEFEHPIDYIEIHYPIAFLPKSITIVDTPGIGAVYADHERITRRYLQKASAVIFITDPQNPLTNPERDFVDSALDVTDKMVFVMTKMDNYDNERIVNMVRRNEEILQPLADRVDGGKIAVLPMSSKILSDAARNEDETLRTLDLAASQFEQVKNSILTMIYTMVGLGDNVVFTNRMIEYNTRVMAIIQERSAALKDDKQGNALLKQKQDLQLNFNNEWGPGSTRYKVVAQRIADEANSIPNRIAMVCNTNGSVYNRFVEEINALTKSKEAKEYGKNLPTRFQEAIDRGVRSEIEAVSDNISKAINDYAQEAKSFISAPDNASVEGLSVCMVNTDVDTLTKGMSSFRMNYMNVILFTAVGAALGPVGAIVGFLGAIMAGIFMSEKDKHRKCKMELNNYITKASGAAYAKLCVEANPITQAEKCKREIREKADTELKDIFETQHKMVEERIDSLKAQIQANASKRQAIQAGINDLTAKWKPIHTTLVELKSDIESLGKEIKTA